MVERSLCKGIEGPTIARGPGIDPPHLHVLLCGLSFFFHWWSCDFSWLVSSQVHLAKKLKICQISGVRIHARAGVFFLFYTYIFFCPTSLWLLFFFMVSVSFFAKLIRKLKTQLKEIRKISGIRIHAPRMGTCLGTCSKHTSAWALAARMSRLQSRSFSVQNLEQKRDCSQYIPYTHTRQTCLPIYYSITSYM